MTGRGFCLIPSHSFESAGRSGPYNRSVVRSIETPVLTELGYSVRSSSSINSWVRQAVTASCSWKWPSSLQRVGVPVECKRQEGDIVRIHSPDEPPRFVQMSFELVTRDDTEVFEQKVEEDGEFVLIEPGLLRDLALMIPQLEVEELRNKQVQWSGDDNLACSAAAMRAEKMTFVSTTSRIRSVPVVLRDVPFQIFAELHGFRLSQLAL